MKGIAIGFSVNSANILGRLRKTEYINEIYLAASTRLNKFNKQSLESIKVKDYLKLNWTKIDLLVFVGSISASIRLINPFLVSKDSDPAVIVMDNDCSKVIPLIGAHQSNAHNITLELSNLYGGALVETSNSKNKGLLKIDSFGNEWGWNRSGSIKNWSKLVISQSREEKIYFDQSSGNELWRNTQSAKDLCLQKSSNIRDDSQLTFKVGIYKTSLTAWHPPTLWIGLGCERNTSQKLIEDSLFKLLEINNLSPLSIAGLATINIKKNETAFLEISQKYNWPIRFFMSEDLLKINVPNPSKIVLNEIGSPSVAEASCLLAAGDAGKLMIDKTVFKSPLNDAKISGAVTIAIAESKKQFAPHKGEIHIVGSGPGDLSYLTFDAKKALSSCAVWIGYKMYLDLLEPFKRKDQVRIDSELTQERQRCQEAISIAQEGIKVSLISSGDAGIYGMAGLLLELIQKIDKRFRPNLAIHPGISSMQLAASISGAPLMNDFCSISLSDKLTPWKVIEKRVEAACIGDFVVTLFNPKSIERSWQLKKTIDIFLKYRNENTPVVLTRQVGREKQTKKFFTLNAIPIEEVDMLSLLIIGNSQTELRDNIFLTKRGYL